MTSYQWSVLYYDTMGSRRSTDETMLDKLEQEFYVHGNLLYDGFLIWYYMPKLPAGVMDGVVPGNRNKRGTSSPLIDWKEA